MPWRSSLVFIIAKSLIVPFTCQTKFLEVRSGNQAKSKPQTPRRSSSRLSTGASQDHTQPCGAEVQPARNLPGASARAALCGQDLTRTALALGLLGGGNRVSSTPHPPAFLSPLRKKTEQKKNSQ